MKNETHAIPEEVGRESAVLDTVKAQLARLKKAEKGADLHQVLFELRQSLGEERLPEDIASVMEQISRTEALLRQQGQGESGEVDEGSPYFARMLLDDDFGQRTVLIGKSTLLSDRVRIVDWRNAPISRLFYQYEEGDDYDETVNGRDVSGVVLERRTVTIAEGELERVGSPDHQWVRQPDGAWIDLRDQEARLAGGAQTAIRPDSLGTGYGQGGGKARQDKHLPEIASLVDKEQFKLITAGDSGVVAIQGSAGSGKTTVGLHRIAWLHYQNPAVFRPSAMLIIVFSRALANYISKVLPALGVDGVQVQGLLRWLEWLRRYHYRDLPSRYADDTPEVVIRFKTHAAILKMIDEAKDKGLLAHGDPLRAYEELLTDKLWIEEGLQAHAAGEFTDREIERIHHWCVNQSFSRDEGGGDDDDEPPRIDREDDPILLYLYQQLKGPLRDPRSGGRRGGRPLQYAHMMVDEAQDLSALELAVLIGSAGRRRSVTLAGDVAQKIAEHRDFPSWTEVLDVLGLGYVNVSPLQVSYRSTRAIMEVARAILGPLAPDEPVVAPREGAPVGHLRFHSQGEAATWLGPALIDLMLREPLASVAILCADLDLAADWYQILDRSQVPYIQYVGDMDFSFAPGIEVTDIRSSKGLEFDYVIVVDTNAELFDLRDASRHLLHVAATRAAHQLWFVSTDRPTLLLPEGLAGR